MSNKKRAKANRAASYDGPFQAGGQEFRGFDFMTLDYVETFGVDGIFGGAGNAPANNKEAIDQAVTLAWTMWADEDLVDEVALLVEDASTPEERKAAAVRLKQEVRKLKKALGPLENIAPLVKHIVDVAERVNTLDFSVVARPDAPEDEAEPPGNS